MNMFFTDIFSLRSRSIKRRHERHRTLDTEYEYEYEFYLLHKYTLTGLMAIWTCNNWQYIYIPWCLMFVSFLLIYIDRYLHTGLIIPYFLLVKILINLSLLSFPRNKCWFPSSKYNFFRLLLYLLQSQKKCISSSITLQSVHFLSSTFLPKYLPHSICNLWALILNDDKHCLYFLSKPNSKYSSNPNVSLNNL